MPSRRLAVSILLASVGAVLFSAKAVVVKLSYRYGVEASTVLALRMLFAQPFFLAAYWWESSRGRLNPVSAKDKLHMLFLGFVGYYFSSYLDFLGLQYVTVGLERLILYLTPTCVLVISAIWFNKRIQPRQWVAMLIAYIGVFLVFFQDVRLEGSQVALGSFLVFVSTVSYAVYLILSGEIVARVGSIRLVAYASLSSAFFSLLHALLTDPVALWSQPAEVYSLTLLNSSLCTFVPMLLVMVAIHRIGSGLTSQSSVAGPIATVFLGWFFLGEPISPMQILGMSIVLISIAVLLTTKVSAESQ